MNIMITCKKTTELIEKRNVEKLTFNETLKLQLHKLICKACRIYEKQSLLIDKSIQKFSKRDGVPSIKLSSDVKSKILDQINKISF
jgi:hypothetical protein